MLWCAEEGEWVECSRRRGLVAFCRSWHCGCGCDAAVRHVGCRVDEAALRSYSLFLVVLENAQRICHCHRRFGYEHGNKERWSALSYIAFYHIHRTATFSISNVCSTSHDHFVYARHQLSVQILPSSHILPFSSTAHIQLPSFSSFTRI